MSERAAPAAETSLRWLGVPDETAQAILTSPTPDSRSTAAALLDDLGSLEPSIDLPDHPGAPYF